MAMAKIPEYLLLGEVLRPHGIRGELRMRILTDYPERIIDLDYVYLGTSPSDSHPVRHTVEHIRFHQSYGLLKLDSVKDRTDAERFRQMFVMVHIDDAVPLEDDEVYLWQLIGMRVQTENGISLGTIKDVLETGANDVYILDSPQYGELLIPVTDETLLETNTDTGVITVVLPEGLLPD